MKNAFRHFLRLAFVSSCIMLCTSVPAQQNRFVFIQAENSQPFYVRIGETVYNSSSVGHLVIHGLIDSAYRFAIGFPHTNFKEQQFSVRVKRKDCGFQLKKADARSWVLYNWQSDETLRSPRTDSLLYGERKKDDGFASLMAAVVNDSAVLYTSIVKAETPKETPAAAADTIKAAAQNDPPKATTALVDSAKSDAAVRAPAREKETPDSTILVKTSESQEQAQTDSAAVAAPSTEAAGRDAGRSPIVNDTTASIAKLAEKTSAGEKKLVFLDNTIGIKKDTITVIIPLDKDTSAVARNAPSRNADIADSTSATVPEQRVSDPVIAKAKPQSEEKAAPKINDVVRDTALVMQATENRSDTAADVAAVRAHDKPDTTVAATATRPTQQITDTATTAATTQPAPPERDKTTTVQPANMPDSAVTGAGVEEPEKSSGLVMVNSDCVKFATEHDVDKLRVKMLAQKDPGNRIFTAHKVFRNMCFTTKQVKALSELFPDDELRFRFFETAWPFISDSSQFKTLEETLTDPFFITRFRTLLKR